MRCNKDVHLCCAVLLSTLGVVLTSGITGLFCCFVLKFDLLESMLVGAAIGVATAFLAYFMLKRMNFGTNGFESILVFAMALVSYSLSSVIGGNGYLAVYITGIILGNMEIPNKKSLVHFFDGVTGLMQILIFFLLGLVAFPSQMLPIILPALAIALFLTFVARPLSVFAILTPFRCPIKQQLLVSWSGLRGAASIVFAIMAVVSPAYLKNDVFHVVFFIVLFSISIQGTLIPFVAKRLDMIDNKSDVMKTFNDYTKEVPVQFIKLPIDKKHPWANKKVCNIHFLPNTILALIIREDKQIVPRGDTTLLECDIAVLSGPSLEKKFTGHLTEIEIDSDSEWIGMALSEIDLDSDKLVTLIKRGKRIVIPSGKTVVKENDVLIINKTQK